MTQELIVANQVEEICGRRSQAIAAYLDVYDNMHKGLAIAGSLSIAGNLPLSGGGYDSEKKLSNAFFATGEQEKRDRESGQMIKFDARDGFESLVKHSIDKACWTHMMDDLGYERLMDRQAREEFRDGMRNPPEFTPENCEATFSDIWGKRHEVFLRGIANTFQALDRRFRSHDGFKIGSRLILERALENYSWGAQWTRRDRRDTLVDVERVFRELDGLGPVAMSESIESYVTEATKNATLPVVVQGDYFRIRIFKNGNLHIWFERKDLLEQVNKLLAAHYGEVIGDGFNETEAEETPEYHVTPAKGFGYFPTPDAVVNEMFGYYKGKHEQQMRDLEPSAGCGRIARKAKERGGRVTCVEIQPGMAHELRVLHGFDDVHNQDFLTMTQTELGQFDNVIMNPPFDRGRDCDHVRHAMQFVKPGGRLVAIMSARAEFNQDKRHKSLHKAIESWTGSNWDNRKWHDLPPGSFAESGTNVNTVILAITRPTEGEE